MICQHYHGDGHRFVGKGWDMPIDRHLYLGICEHYRLTTCVALGHVDQATQNRSTQANEMRMKNLHSQYTSYKVFADNLQIQNSSLSAELASQRNLCQVKDTKIKILENTVKSIEQLKKENQGITTLLGQRKLELQQGQEKYSSLEKQALAEKEKNRQQTKTIEELNDIIENLKREKLQQNAQHTAEKTELASKFEQSTHAMQATISQLTTSNSQLSGALYAIRSHISSPSQTEDDEPSH
jgi:hypothetical protein